MSREDAKEFKRGYNDYYAGRDDCPYEDAEDKTNWRRGWTHAKNEDAFYGEEG